MVNYHAGWAFAVMAGVYTARAVGGLEVGYINPVGPLAGVLTGTLAVRAAARVRRRLRGSGRGVRRWRHRVAALPPALEGNARCSREALPVFCTAPAIRDYLPANVLSEAIATFVLVFVGTAVVEKD